MFDLLRQGTLAALVIDAPLADYYTARFCDLYQVRGEGWTGREGGRKKEGEGREKAREGEGPGVRQGEREGEAKRFRKGEGGEFLCRFSDELQIFTQILPPRHTHILPHKPFPAHCQPLCLPQVGQLLLPTTMGFLFLSSVPDPYMLYFDSTIQQLESSAVLVGAMAADARGRLLVEHPASHL